MKKLLKLIFAIQKVIIKKKKEGTTMTSTLDFEYFELFPSIKNVLNSDFTTKKLSDFCNVSSTSIADLRTGKRHLDNTSLQTALSLYRFSVQNNLNAEYLRAKDMKGKLSSIPLNLPLKKVTVSFAPLDLFSYGLFKQSDIKNEIPQNTNVLKKINLSTAVFTTKDDKLYDCYEFGYSFNCRYVGAGPNNFIRFIENFSNIDEKTLKEIVYANSVVEYDFQNDTITGYPSLIEGQPLTLLSLNEKLIIMLDKYNNSFNQSSRNSVNLKSALSDISFISDILDKNYDLDSELKTVCYIPKEAQNDLHALNDLHSFERSDNGIQLVLEYTDFEIWIPYHIKHQKGDIAYNEEIRLFLDALGVPCTPLDISLTQKISNVLKSDNSHIRRFPAK